MFDQVQIPTPFEIGPVNCYIAGRTLVDPGPDSDEGWDVLTDALSERELTPGDVERVMITHPHPDHFGMAKRLADAGATILASADAVGIVEDFAGRLAYEQEFFHSFLTHHGLPADVVSTIIQLPEAYLEFAPSCEVDEALDDGDPVSIANGTVHVESITGHAPGEVLYRWQNTNGDHAIVGDHVLQRITPNPFLQPPPDDDSPRPRVLPAYNRSLERLATRDFETLHPGHGDRISNPTHRIERLLEYHERRSEKVIDAIEGPTTAEAVMRSLFGDLPVTQMFGGISEAVGHLDVLELRGKVERTFEDGRYRYRLIDQ